MKKSFWALLVPLYCIIVGCVAPGSSLTRLRVQGEIVNQSENGVTNQEVTLGFAKQYGLAGLDAIWGKPESYGHHDQTITISTNENGIFDHTFDPTTYSISFWILPPIGVIPKNPPEPFFFLRIDDNPNEYYYIHADRDKISYKVISRYHKDKLDKSPSRPFTLSGELLEDKFDNFKGWLVRFKLSFLYQ